MPDEYMRVTCPHCNNQVFVPISTPIITEPDCNDIVHIEYRSAICPSCFKSMRIIERSFIEMTKGVVQKYEDSDLFDIGKDIYKRYENTISVIEKDIKEKLLDDNKKEKMFKVSLIAPDGKELTDKNSVLEYIRENFDQNDLEDWINDNFDTVEIGPYSWSPVEIIDDMGESYSEIAEYDTYGCSYSVDRYDDSDVIDIDEEFDVNTVPEDESEIVIAGLTFKYKVKEVE